MALIFIVTKQWRGTGKMLPLEILSPFLKLNPVFISFALWHLLCKSCSAEPDIHDAHKDSLKIPLYQSCPSQETSAAIGAWNCNFPPLFWNYERQTNQSNGWTWGLTRLVKLFQSRPRNIIMQTNIHILYSIYNIL